MSVATPRGGSPEGFGTAPSEVAPVLLMLDDQFRIRSGDGSGAHLFDAPPRAGRPIFDLVGDYLGGDEPPGADCAYPPLHRIESRFRTGAGGSVSILMTRLSDGWLAECRDATVSALRADLVDRLAEAADAAACRGALLHGLCAGLDLSYGEIWAPAPAGGLRADAIFCRREEWEAVAARRRSSRCATPGAVQAPPVDPDTAFLVLALRDAEGLLGMLILAPEGCRVVAAGLEAQIAALLPPLLPAIRHADTRDRLAAEQRRIRGILSVAAEAVVAVDADGHIVEFSDGAERMFGSARAEVLGCAFDILLAEDDHGSGRETRRKLTAPFPAAFERIATVGRRCDGTAFEAHASAIAAAGDGGAVATIVFEDISIRRAAEAALERNRSQTAAILESLRDAVFAVDQDLTVVYANGAAAELLAREADDIVGAPAWEGACALWDVLGPELFRCLRQREKQEIEICWPRADRWFDARILPTESGASVFLLDVTDRRRAATLQRENDARHRAVSALTTDLVLCYRVDMSGLLDHEWSIGRAGDVLGRELPDQVKMVGLVASAHPHDRAIATAFTLRLLENEDASAELRVVTPVGGARWIEVHGKPEWDDVEGRVGRIICSIRDITERKRTETALRESEERFALAIEGAAEGLWDWNMRRRTIYRSEHLRGILAIPPDEDIQRWGWWIEQVHPQDRKRYRLALRRHRESRDNLFASEYRVRHRDGGWRWMLDRAVSRRGADGRVERIVGSVSDITDRKSMEIQLKEANAAIEEKNRQIRIALDNISQGLTMYDSENRLVLFNRRYAELYGLGDTLRVGTTLQAMLRASAAVGNYLAEDAEAITRRRLDAAAAPGPRQLTHRMSNGTTIEANTQPLPGGGSVATFTDITSREQREQELRSARDAAEAASRAKSAFLANMSHELRTPLNAIIGFSEVMKEEMFGPLGGDMYRTYAGDIHASGQMLLDLINDILDISKIEAGKAEVAEDVFDLAGAVRASIALCRDQAAGAALTLRARIDRDLPNFRGDERYLRQILINLLSNAIKFTPAGGRITVRASRGREGGIAITVADTGIGIPDRHLTRVFEPFYQVQSDLARTYQGTGLGLSLVRGLVELHGGRVEAARRRHRGTIFRVHLPPFRVAAS